MTLLVLVVDDEPDVEALFRQQFRRELRAERFTMEFAQSAALMNCFMTVLHRHSTIAIFCGVRKGSL